MKLSDLKTADQIAAADHAADPEYRAEWDRTAFARQVALAVVAYRAEHDLSQRALAQAMGVKQPAIARLEAGSHEPQLSTLARLTAVTGLHLRLDVARGGVDMELVAA